MAGKAKKHIAKDGTVSWHIRVDLGINPRTGKRDQPYDTFPTEKEANAWAASQEHARNTGTLIYAGKVTVATYLTEWLEGRLDIRETTKITYSRLLSHRILPGLGSILLGALRQSHVKKFLLSQGHEVAPATVKLMKALLSRAFEDAKREKLLAINPARDLASVVRKDTREGKVKYWDPTQAQHFLVHTTDHEDAMLWRLLLASGLRIGEALALRWQDVDLNTGVVTVRRTLSRITGGYDAKAPKTKSGLRAIPLDAATSAALREHRQSILRLRVAHADIWTDRDLVFPADDGGFRLPNTTRKRFAALCGKLTLLHIGVHGLRHTHATLLLISGTPAKVVSERLGHSSIAITLNTYSHVTPELQQEAARSIGALLG